MLDEIRTKCGVVALDSDIDSGGDVDFFVRRSWGFSGIECCCPGDIYVGVTIEFIVVIVIQDISQTPNRRDVLFFLFTLTIINLSFFFLLSSKFR